MIVDTSVLVAVLFGEPDSAHFIEQIRNADQCFLSAVSFVELSMVVAGQLGLAGLHECDRFILSAGIGIEPVTVEQGQLARQAFLNFGKGRHPAGLNFGDCFSYALAKSKKEPLLFKGRDFSRTDIRAAL